MRAALPAARQPSRPRPALRTDVQALRAVAVGLVFADHLLGTPSGGFLGVDVFFVISGYLITGLLLREGDRSGRVSIREFYARRIRRILPAAVLVLVTTWVAARVVLSALRAEQAQTDGLWALLFSANRRFADLGTDYFAEGRPVSPVQHYWSLSVEEQFYLAWPLVVLLAFWLARRHVLPARRMVVPVGVAGVVTSFALCLHLSTTDPTGAYFSTLARTWELGAGALLAVAQPRLSRLPDRVRGALAWAGLAGISYAAVVVGATTRWPGPMTLLPVLATAAVLASDDPASGPSRLGLGANRVVQRVGLLSYGLYLWHWPVIVIAQAWFGGRTTGFHVVALTLPVALAALSHRWVEAPIHHSSWLSRREGPRPDPASWVRAHRRPLRSGVAVATAVVLVPVLSGFALPQDPAQVPAAVVTAPPTVLTTSLRATSWPAMEPPLQDLPDAGAPEWVRDGCLDVDPDDVARCTYGSGPRTALVLGDSLAVSYLPGIRRALGDGWRVTLLTRQQCPFVDLRTLGEGGVAFPACYDQRRFEVAQVRLRRPDLVVVSSQAMLFAGRIIGRSPDPLANVAQWRAGSERLLRQVAPYAGRLVVLSGPPNGTNLQECYATRRVRPTECISRVSAAWKRTTAAEAAATRAVGGTYVSTLSWFCTHDLCPPVVGRTPVFWDGFHLTRRYSEALAPRLRAVLLTRPA